VTGIVEGAGLILKGARAATWSIQLFNRSSEQRTLAMEEGYRDNVRHDWQLQRNQRIEDRLAILEENVANRETLERLLTDEFFWILRNYEFEAQREATAERRRMLAFASAGSVNLELTIAEIARVERTVRELDPHDVLLLRQLAQITDPPPPPVPRAMDTTNEIYGPWEKSCAERAEERRSAADSSAPFGEILTSAGCTAITPLRNTYGQTFPTGIRVTRLGEHVLKIMHGYIVARSDEASEDKR
jgi:hypothetical protein